MPGLLTNYCDCELNPDLTRVDDRAALLGCRYGVYILLFSDIACALLFMGYNNSHYLQTALQNGKTLFSGFVDRPAEPCVQMLMLVRLVRMFMPSG